MLINRTCLAIVVIVSLFGNTFAQLQGQKLSEISPELKKNAVDFLRETIKEIPKLKADENRQYFTIETARLLWKYDEKEARKMFESVMQEVKHSFSKTAEKYRKAVEERKKLRANTRIDYGMNGAYPTSNKYYANSNIVAANTMANYETEISIYELGMADEFRKVASLRKNLLESLINFEPSLAYQFFTETNQILPKNRNNYLYHDYSLTERRVVTEMLKRNEIDKALEVARDVLNKKVLSENFRIILTEIYEKNAVKGSKLAEELLETLKHSDLTEIDDSLLSLFFYNAVESKQQNQPLLSEKSIRDLAKLLGQEVLARMDTGYYSNPADYARRIKDYAPREALKILQKSKKIRKSNIPYYPSNAANVAANAVNAAANAARAAAMAANKAAGTPARLRKSKPKEMPQIVETVPMPEAEFPGDTKDDLIQKLRVGKFTPEERKEIIKLAKEYALANQSWSYYRPNGFIGIVGELARFSLFSADKEVADELMKEAEVYVRPENKNYVDYVGKLLLAGGYSSHHPEKSFALMESMVTINEVIESAVKFGVFFDVETNLILGDEVSALFFLGDNRGIGSLAKETEFRMFIQNLAKSDFQRTKNLADKFEKKEVKMAAKILILDSLLGE